MSVVPLSPKIELSGDDVHFDDGCFLLVKDGRPATGRVVTRAGDGTIRRICDLYRGFAHGLWQQFYENGDLEHWCRYSHGKQEFYDEWYDTSGALIQSDCWSAGLKHGRCKSYELGQLSAIQDFKNGLRHGLWETYGPRGVTFFSGRFIEDEPDGLHVWRFVNNKPESEKRYDRGVRTGEWRDFYNTGSIKRWRKYSGGLIDGEDRRYYENGVLATFATYKRGQLDGPSLEFHPNGKLKRSVPQKKGGIEGVERHFDEQVRVRREIQWRNGKSLSDLNFILGR